MLKHINEKHSWFDIKNTICETNMIGKYTNLEAEALINNYGLYPEEVYNDDYPPVFYEQNDIKYRILSRKKDDKVNYVYNNTVYNISINHKLLFDKWIEEYKNISVSRHITIVLLDKTKQVIITNDGKVIKQDVKHYFNRAVYNKTLNVVCVKGNGKYAKKYNILNTKGEYLLDEWFALPDPQIRTNDKVSHILDMLYRNNSVKVYVGDLDKHEINNNTILKFNDNFINANINTQKGTQLTIATKNDIFYDDCIEMPDGSFKKIKTIFSQGLYYSYAGETYNINIVKCNDDKIYIVDRNYVAREFDDTVYNRKITAFDSFEEHNAYLHVYRKKDQMYYNGLILYKDGECNFFNCGDKVNVLDEYHDKINVKAYSSKLEIVDKGKEPYIIDITTL